MNRKGQFFIISAVVIVSVLFALYEVYLGYYVVDTSFVQRLDNTYLLKDIELQTKNLHSNDENLTCREIRDHLDTYKTFLERSVTESAHILKYSYNSSRGCIKTDFDFELKTRDSKVTKKLSLSVPHTEFGWDMYSSDTFDDNIVENTDISYSDGVLKLVDGKDKGKITYWFDPNKRVIWYKHQFATNPAQTSNVKIYWWINESPCPGPQFCRIDSFNDLPEEFQWLNQTIELTRLSDGSSPIVSSTNTTYATRP